MRNKLYLLCLQAFMLFSLGASTTIVQADTPFIGEVRWFAGNFAPRGWALCDGQLLSINSNQHYTHSSAPTMAVMAVPPLVYPICGGVACYITAMDQG